MNKAIIKSVQDLESRLNAGLISERFFRGQLKRLLEVTDNPKDQEYIKLHMDREI